jgi:hypothetical protein
MRIREHRIGVTLQDLTHGARHGTVTREIGRDKDHRRAEMRSIRCGHRRAHSKIPCLVGDRAEDRALSEQCHDNRLVAQLWIVALFDGCVESIHADMNNLSPAHSVSMAGRLDSSCPQDAICRADSLFKSAPPGAGSIGGAEVRAGRTSLSGPTDGPKRVDLN